MSADPKPTILLRCELTVEQAQAFAQFLKRAGYADFKRVAVDTEEAYVMRDAGERIRAALADEGFKPR